MPELDKKRFRILIITELFPAYEGDMTGVFFIDYIRSIYKFCDVTVFSTRLKGKKGLQKREMPGIKIYSFSITSRDYVNILKPFLYVILLFKSFRAGKKLGKFDIIHSLTFGGSVGAILAWLLRKKMKSPLVFTENFGPFSALVKKPLLRLRIKWVLEKPDVLTVVSNHLKNEILEAGIKPASIYITYNPIDTELFSVNKIQNNNIHKMLFVGRLDQSKGGFRTVQAFDKIFKKNPNWNLMIVGEGQEYYSIKEYLKENENLNYRVELQGQKSKSEISELMNESDFFILPTEFESFGIAIAEAMSAGLPVITGNKTAPAEFVDQDCGILINAGSVDEIASAMEFMMHNYTKYDPEIIRKKIVDNYSLDIFGERFYNIYKSLLISCAE